MSTLNQPISPAEMKNVDQRGSVGFLFHENKTKDDQKSDRVLAVTNHHVVCKDKDKLYHFRAPSSPLSKSASAANAAPSVDSPKSGRPLSDMATRTKPSALRQMIGFQTECLD